MEKTTYNVTITVKVSAPTQYVRTVTKYVHSLAQDLLVGEEYGEVEIVGASVENDAMEV